MQIELILHDRTTRYLISNLGENKVTILSTDKDGYHHVSFEVKHNMDVLAVLHAGQDAGIEIATERYTSATVA